MAEVTNIVIKFILYDGVGIALVISAIYFFMRSSTLAENQSYIASVISGIIAIIVLIAGMKILKVSAAAKSREAKPPEE